MTLNFFIPRVMPGDPVSSLTHLAGALVFAILGGFLIARGRGAAPRVISLTLFVSSCVDAYVSRYFLTTRVPPRGTVCEPDVVPFAEPAAAQAVSATAEPSKAELIPPMLRRMLAD